MRFNFRLTSGFVTDDGEGVPVLGETFPHTYTNGNGFSISAGWDGTPGENVDRTNTNDPRIAGINAHGSIRTFTVDLSSGSAPGAADYIVDIAAGDATNFRKSAYKLLDNATLLIDGSGAGVGTNTPGGQFLDATASIITASTTWTGTPVTKTFATTTAKLVNNPDSIGTTTCIAHLRLAKVAAAVASMLAPPNRYATMLAR